MSTVEPRPISPWHAGEIAIQSSLGVAERMEVIGRHVIRDHLNEQHRSFYPLLPFVVLGAVDPAGDVWATLRTGKPGFLQAPDPFQLRIAAKRDLEDPAEAGMEDRQSIGLLGIEFHTRRRNRLNGTIRRRRSDSFAIEIEQSFGNCPRYIWPRRSAIDPGGHAIPKAPIVSSRLDDRARAMIAEADTFFVATSAELDGEQRQVDVSHRGGPTRFVRMDDEGVLTIPDYAGNRFFNTLGNLVTNPSAGLVFVDFTTGDLLQMTGRTEIIFDSPEIATFAGAERLWRFVPKLVAFRAEALSLRFLPPSDGESVPAFT